MKNIISLCSCLLFIGNIFGQPTDERPIVKVLSFNLHSGYSLMSGLTPERVDLEDSFVSTRSKPSSSYMLGIGLGVKVSRKFRVNLDADIHRRTLSYIQFQNSNMVSNELFPFGNDLYEEEKKQDVIILSLGVQYSINNRFEAGFSVGVGNVLSESFERKVMFDEEEVFLTGSNVAGIDFSSPQYALTYKPFINYRIVDNFYVSASYIYQPRSYRSLSDPIFDIYGTTQSMVSVEYRI